MPAADVQQPTPILCKPMIPSISRPPINHSMNQSINHAPKKLTVIPTIDEGESITIHQPVNQHARMPTISRSVSSPDQSNNYSSLGYNVPSPIASASPSIKRYAAQPVKPAIKHSTPSIPSTPKLFSPVFHNPPHSLEEVGVEPQILVQKRQELQSTIQHIDEFTLNDNDKMIDEEDELTGSYSCPSTPSHASINWDDDRDPFLFIKTLPPTPIIYQLANQMSRKPALPPASSNKITLALDLDETLVHCSIRPLDNAQLTFPVMFMGVNYEVHVRIRPYLSEFLQSLSGLFEVVLFTASQSIYADALLDLLDPGRRFIHHRIFRDSCLCYKENYLKDLSILGRPLERVAIVDNSIQAFALHLDNGIPITSWYDDEQDQELRHLIPFLKRLAKQNDVRPFLKEFFGLRSFIDSLGKN